MYVNPFWFGVLTTIVVEVVGIVMCALIVAGRDDKHERH